MSVCITWFDKRSRFRDKCRYVHGDKCPHCLKNCILPNNPDHKSKHIESCKLPKSMQLLDPSNAIEGVFLAQAREIINKSREMECCVCLEVVVNKADSRFGLLSTFHG
jgi:hypothetical protein